MTAFFEFCWPLLAAALASLVTNFGWRAAAYQRRGIGFLLLAAGNLFWVSAFLAFPRTNFTIPFFAIGSAAGTVLAMAIHVARLSGRWPYLAITWASAPALPKKGGE